jgi:adenine specific DNA methylase Mod
VVDNHLNKLFFGDNLDVLRNHIRSESVDLIYLDPPFNSNANYNVLFREPGKGSSSEAQITAFEDTWHWGEESAHQLEQLRFVRGDLAGFLEMLVHSLGHNDLSAYLVTQNQF